MRSRTQKLSLTSVALLLAHCALPGDSEPSATDESAASVGDDGSFDSRDGLLPLDITGAAPRARSNDPEGDAIAYLSNTASRVGLTSPAFRAKGVATGTDGLTHVRVQQTYEGVPVWGADCVVHLSNGSVLGAAGTIAKRLDVTTKTASLSPSAALAKAKADRFGSRQVITEREQVEQVVHVDTNGTARMAIHTSFYNELQGNVQPGLWNQIYDASSGKLLARWNDLHTLEQASGPGGNPKWVHSWDHELDVEPRGDQFVMTTATLKTIDMQNASSRGIEIVGPLDAIGEASINDAHGFAEVTLEILQQFGHDSIDDRGFRIVSRVHYGPNFRNAFWDGTGMTYGDGGDRFYPLSGGLDVVAHEIHHGFTSFHSNLAYRGESGGLNEAFSDIAGKTAEFFYKGTTSFDIGTDVFKQAGAVRYMCDPKKDGRSIDHASNMTPSLDPHYSSGVPNKAFCRAAKRFSTAGDPEGTATRDGVLRTARAFYLANGQYWTSSTKFVAACKGTLDAARALQFTDDEIGYLKSSWDDVGVVCE